jgi:hypothetical protein
MRSYPKARVERILHGKDKARFYSYVTNELKSAHSISKLILSDSFVIAATLTLLTLLALNSVKTTLLFFALVYFLTCSLGHVR